MLSKRRQSDVKRKPTCAPGLAGVEGSEGSGGSPDGSQTVSVWIIFESRARRSGYFQRQHPIADIGYADLDEGGYGRKSEKRIRRVTGLSG